MKPVITIEYSYRKRKGATVIHLDETDNVDISQAIEFLAKDATENLQRMVNGKSDYDLQLEQLDSVAK
jgi:hypothetical protein